MLNIFIKSHVLLMLPKFWYFHPFLPFQDLHLPHKQESACVPFSQHSITTCSKVLSTLRVHWPYWISGIGLEPPEKLRSKEAGRRGNTANSPDFIKLVLIGWIRSFLSMIPRIQTAQDWVRRQQVSGKEEDCSEKAGHNILPQSRLGHSEM